MGSPWPGHGWRLCHRLSGHNGVGSRPSPVPSGKHISPRLGTKAGRLWFGEPIPAAQGLRHEGHMLTALLGPLVVLMAGTQDPPLKDFDFAKVVELRAPATGDGPTVNTPERPFRTHSVWRPWNCPDCCPAGWEGGMPRAAPSASP